MRLIQIRFRCSHTAAASQLRLVGPLPEYRRRIAANMIRADEDQHRAAVALQKLCESLLDYSPPAWDAPQTRLSSLLRRSEHGSATTPVSQAAAAAADPAAPRHPAGPLASLASAASAATAALAPAQQASLLRSTTSAAAALGPRGVWLHGGVGTGKTMIMDMFFDTVPVERKMRMHFHAFMLSVYAKAHDWHKLDGLAKQEHVMDRVARDILASSWLICLDEFQITDIATAAILKQIFRALFLHGAVIVTTSNRLPHELYAGGFQRSHNQNFIDMLNERCHLVHLRSDMDYRTSSFEETHFDGPDAVARSYYKIITPEDADAFVKRVGKLFYGKEVRSASVRTHGFNQTIHRAADGIALFTFEELCGSSVNPWGPAQYLRLCASFHTIVVQGIPVMGLVERNEARRFITFVDAAYENKASGPPHPDDLFIVAPIGDDQDTADSVMHREMMGDLIGEATPLGDAKSRDDGTNLFRLAIFTGEEERFAFRRAVSRLKEMQTKAFLDSPHSPRAVPLHGLATDDGPAVDPAAPHHSRRARRTIAGGRAKPADAAAQSGFLAAADDFGDEASFRGVLRQFRRHGSGGDGLPAAHDAPPRIDPGAEALASRPMPRFGERHFWGLGEWGVRAGEWGEGVRVFMNRIRGRPKP
ncbi:hypothetical protein HK105_207211 [Polyrhizophydium stewartii]|uniref:AFG1-like ATPase n=1 Tax=Polyrhizophydium stewartii TaxID=2732419 RepID=A0ABR4N1E2_9FUNG